MLMMLQPGEKRPQKPVRKIALWRKTITRRSDTGQSAVTAAQRGERCQGGGKKGEPHRVVEGLYAPSGQYHM